MVSDEPWMLDQVANEERLNMTFKHLLSFEENFTLSGYLTQIYRFLGLYVAGIGMFLLAFSSEKVLKISSVNISHSNLNKSGGATVVLPFKDGMQVPYPFDPGALGL